MDDLSLLHMPPEVVWTIADILLLCPPGDPKAVVRLGLTCMPLYSILVDDEAKWTGHFRRRYGSARVALSEKVANAGARWSHVYVAAIRVHEMPSGWHGARAGMNGLATLRAPWAVYRGSVTDGRPAGYGLCVTRDGDRTDVRCFIVAETQLSGDPECATGFIHARRAETVDGADEPREGGGPHATNACPCALCRDRVPTLTGPLRGAIVAYTGGWDAGRLHGRGRALFVGGFVYEGEWAGGLPHGHGTLNGIAYRWHRGLPIRHGRCTLDDPASGRWAYEGDVLVGSCDGADDLAWRWSSMVRDNDAHALARLSRSTFFRGPGCTGSLSDTSEIEPHGSGVAVHGYGRTYRGTYRLGRHERGQCTFFNGTTLDGIWWNEHDGGAGTVASPGDPHPTHVVWDARYQTCQHDPRQGRRRERGPHAAGNTASSSVCTCMPRRPAHYAGGRGGQYDHHYVIHRNGDVCGVECGNLNGSGRDDVAITSVLWFACSAACPDPDFAGLVLFPKRGWSHARPEGTTWTSTVYWPADTLSATFARFIDYVRKGLVAWDAQMTDFFWQTMNGLGVPRSRPISP